MKIRILDENRLEIVVFLCGAVVMIIELVGSRVVAPYFGNSLVVWTSLIGVILGSLSAGYYFGGKIADRFRSFETLGILIMCASALTGLGAFFKEPVLAYVSLLFGSELRAASFVAALVLFGPVSFVLGIVSPYSAKLKLINLNSTGRVVGNLSALSTLGSICGTFLAGYFLIPWVGNSKLLYILALVLLGISFLAVSRPTTVDRAFRTRFQLGLLIIFFFILNQIMGIFKISSLADIDSMYSRIIVKSVRSGTSPLLTMSTDHSGIQSAINLQSPDELVFEYTKAYAQFDKINPKIKKALMIGGGGYSFPRYFLLHNHEASIDVVEIDPMMTMLARKYFHLEVDSRMLIFHQDARSFIRNSNKKYDVIFLDAFSSLTPPPHLTTKEFMEDLNTSLTDEGFLMINLISAVDGDNARFLKSERATLLTIFPKVDVYTLGELPLTQTQNLLVVAYKKSVGDYLALGKMVQETEPGNGQVLTDDWSPVEYMTRNYYLR
ncbi:MAG: hypothetical protein UW68_C0017G0014 [Candidatus Collierbacteria bacterium GW2011_GWB1_44_6]|uniref:PABS domain-containing protein n=2 Tax=Candidatus Collieribacteriota TaxID=1752725 RepID=A0A0G1MM38_9BACT|nr:MAG: hypothetical protein UV68_C0002G0030 [Candidatus Collierbacteria bacterium GW2011_GWC2_43_12]KKT73079.1 MAG: hypothetical protein UW68_C0017G0014 [Candidatus Collierbacteria bacterium GW2011_GWB1_44_6]KKT83214.1 MAG: hypothetical protein UW80_C0019G0024 [Microgenomates group bacterium GW2011_GWC1_44_9]